jgi:hypothetical protein
MIFLQKNIPTSWLGNLKADCERLAPPDFLEALDLARQAPVHSGRVVREPRRPLQRAARVRRGFYQFGAGLQNAGRCLRVAR